MSDKIPFSIELFNNGYKVVTRDGREVENFRHISGWLMGTVSGVGRAWLTNGKYYGGRESPYDLFLLPPDEIVVEVKDNGIDVTTKSGLSKYYDVPPGKYKLVKI